MLFIAEDAKAQMAHAPVWPIILYASLAEPQRCFSRRFKEKSVLGQCGREELDHEDRKTLNHNDSRINEYEGVCRSVEPNLA